MKAFRMLATLTLCCISFGVVRSQPPVCMPAAAQLFWSSFYQGNSGNLNLSGITQSEELMLAVNGMVLCKELLVRTTSPIPWPDHVFSTGYELMPLAEVEEYVQDNKHLPGIPCAQEINEQGVNVVDMQAKLLQKIEELTLYVIELKKENEAIKQQLNTSK